MRVLSAAALIWNQPAPLVTVTPSLKREVGRAAAASAWRRATPQGSAGGTVWMFTGTERPWCSPGPSLVSSLVSSGQHSAALQPVQPDAAHSSRSSLGVQKAMHDLWDEQPPSTLARAWRRNELPFSCGSTR